MVGLQKSPQPTEQFWLVLLFASTLFLGSMLMFVVEPMVAKSVLPILGGTPMVWNTCVLFFQIMLVGGYAYAHGVTTWLGARRSSVLYLVLLALPLVALPLVMRPDSHPPVDANPIGWLLIVLFKSIGLPFFALSTTASILQRWFAETDHAAAHDPYFLYAASNLGSLLALLMYPTVIEPTLPLRAQGLVWSVAYGGFVLLACLSVAAGWRRRRGHVAASSPASETGGSRVPIGWTRRIVWVALAFIPSSLMLAVTTYFSTDIAPVPLFWIAPLSIYLLTFVAAFSGLGGSVRSVADRFMPLLVLPVVILMITRGMVPLWLAIPLHLTAFSTAALVCHGRLASDRPPTADLTEFYFWIALGGMLGGAFNTLAAPVLFDRVIEYPIVLVLACAARRGRQSASSGISWSDLVVPVGAGAVTAAVVMWLHPVPGRVNVFVPGIGMTALIAFTQAKVPVRFAITLAAMLMAGTVASRAQERTVYVSRTFFGVYRVNLDEHDEHGQRRRYFEFVHGTTRHGVQAIDPAMRAEPLTYFHRSGPIGQAFAALPGVATRPRIAVVGLGIGTLASYRAPRQQWTFYEIDPEVERIARATSQFTYLSSCGDACRVVLGDARLSLARTDEQYGVIVLDAFSSDAIPLHLLTREALDVYLAHLAPGGVLAFHISNRHLALAPVLARLVVSQGLVPRLQLHNTDPELGSAVAPSEWMLAARSERDLGPLAADPRWQVPQIPASTPLWTDDFSNILSVLRLSLR